MVLSGLGFSSWQAWLTGVYFVKKPWGLPSPTGFCCHPYVVFALTLNIISYGFWCDCQIKLHPLSRNFSLTERILAEAVVLVGAIFDVFFRFNFYRFNVELGELLRALEQPKHKPMYSKIRKCWKFHKISLHILTVPRYVLTITLVGAYGTITSAYPDSEFYYLPRHLYFILFTIFTAIPSVCSVIFAYDLIVITTFHMLWTFEDYCGHLEDHIYRGLLIRRRISRNPSLISLQMSPGKTSAGEDTNCNNIVATNEFRHLKRISDAEEGKGFEKLSFNGFVERFDWINSLAETYDRVIGTIILGVVVRCVISFVHAINAIMIRKEKELYLKVWYHGILLVTEASQLVILKLGSEIHQRIEYWKGKLTKAWLLTSSNVDNLNAGRGQSPLNRTLESEGLAINDDLNVEYDNQLVKDLVNYVCNWNWKVTAAGIFDVDKSLLSGIVSTTLTYVIILFQLSMADSGQEENDGIRPADVFRSQIEQAANASLSEYL